MDCVIGNGDRMALNLLTVGCNAFGLVVCACLTWAAIENGLYVHSMCMVAVTGLLVLSTGMSIATTVHKAWRPGD